VRRRGWWAWDIRDLEAKVLASGSKFAQHLLALKAELSDPVQPTVFNLPNILKDICEDEHPHAARVWLNLSTNFVSTACAPFARYAPLCYVTAADEIHSRYEINLHLTYLLTSRPSQASKAQGQKASSIAGSTQSTQPPGAQQPWPWPATDPANSRAKGLPTVFEYHVVARDPSAIMHPVPAGGCWWSLAGWRPAACWAWEAVWRCPSQMETPSVSFKVSFKRDLVAMDGIPLDVTIGEVTHQLERKLQIAADMQKLLFRGKKLAPELTLAEAGVRPGDKLMLMGKREWWHPHPPGCPRGRRVCVCVIRDCCV
jgi:hypothetical protein